MRYYEVLDRMNIIHNIEKKLQVKVITFYRNSAHGRKAIIDEDTYNLFRIAIDTITENEPLIIILDSKGGISYYGWRIASCIMNRLGATTAVIPEEALSSASMIALASDNMIFFDSNSQLSPVDPQYLHREQWVSALDLLNDEDPVIKSSAKSAIDQTERFLRRLCGSKLSGTKLDQLMERFLLRDRVHADHASSIFLDELVELGLPVEIRTQIDVKALHESYRRHSFNNLDPTTIIEYLKSPIPKDSREILEKVASSDISIDDAEELLRFI